MPERIFNFAAGPATLPYSVLEQAAKDIVNFNDKGIGLIEMSLARNQSAAPDFETLKLPARSENVGREVGHIAQRPCQQRRHDLFGNAWRPVFTGDVPGTGDRERAAPGPRIDTKTGRWKVAAQLVKVEDDAQQYCDRNRT